MDNLISEHCQETESVTVLSWADNRRPTNVAKECTTISCFTAVDMQPFRAFFCDASLFVPVLYGATDQL